MSDSRARIIDAPSGAELTHDQMCGATKVIVGGIVVKDRNGPVGVLNQMKGKSMSNRQFVICKFRETDTRTYTYANDGEPVEAGDVVRVEDRSGDGWKKVFVVGITDREPTFPTKPILGLHREEPDPAEQPPAAA